MTAENLTILDLADGEAEALAGLAIVAQDRAILREMLSESMSEVVRLTAHLEAARRTIAELRRATRSANTSFRSAA